MDLSIVFSRAPVGIRAPLVQVETHLAGSGLPSFNIVGLPETAVRESRDRVRSAIENSHLTFPTDRRITVNLAPADLPKEGSGFDLPIAIGILAASGQLQAQDLAQHEFFGELALGGQLRPVPGAIPAAAGAAGASRVLVLAEEAAGTAAYVPGSRILGAPDLLSLCAHLRGAAPFEAATPPNGETTPDYPDLADVVGQPLARRALEVAAAGDHNLLLFGPPGTGKTLLASRLPGILPPPCAEDALTLLALHSAVQSRPESHFGRRPFRSPHHSATANALVGGGSKPRPGEISLAHGGVLFLDELAEFGRHSLEVLREPLESGEITLSRTRYKITYPARFQLVAATNPCPCGYLGDTERECRCSAEQVRRYRQRLSGPLLDRIDLQVQMSRVPASVLLQPPREEESSAPVRQRVAQAREIQMQRQGCHNARLGARDLQRYCALQSAQRGQLEQAARHMQLSARALHRTLRVALTLADLEGCHTIRATHISEALAYRSAGLDQ